MLCPLLMIKNQDIAYSPRDILAGKLVSGSHTIIIADPYPRQEESSAGGISKVERISKRRRPGQKRRTAMHLGVPAPEVKSEPYCIATNNLVEFRSINDVLLYPGAGPACAANVSWLRKVFSLDFDQIPVTDTARSAAMMRTLFFNMVIRHPTCMNMYIQSATRGFDLMTVLARIHKCGASVDENMFVSMKGIARASAWRVPSPDHAFNNRFIEQSVAAFTKAGLSMDAASTASCGRACKIDGQTGRNVDDFVDQIAWSLHTSVGILVYVLLHTNTIAFQYLMTVLVPLPTSSNDILYSYMKHLIELVYEVPPLLLLDKRTIARSKKAIRARTKRRSKVERRRMDQKRILQHLVEANADYDDTECVVCMDALSTHKFERCGHQVCCDQCGVDLVECPLCRAPV